MRALAVPAARVALGLVLAGLAAVALAGPQVVRGPDGTRWRLNDDDDPPILERRAASGAFDPAFGRNGRQPLDFGGLDAGVAALRVDAALRVWIAATTSAGGTSTPMVQRLLPNGQPDTRWGVAGRSTATPAGQRLMVVDLLPQPDGSAWVTGNLFGPQGESDVGLWHLKPDGALDYGFGMGGLWKRPGGERSRALSLAEGVDGTVALGLERLSGPRPGREVVLVRPGNRTPELAPSPPGAQTGDDEEDEVYLAWGGQSWVWRPGAQTANLSGLAIKSFAAAPAPAPSVPGEAGHIALNPFAQETPVAASAVPPAPAEEWPWAWLIGGLGGLGLLLFVWWRGRGSAG
jgi:hypothetical protein